MSVTLRGSGQVPVQIVQATSTSSFSSSSTSFVSTNFSASITPTNSSNRILILLSSGDLDTVAGGRQMFSTIYRNNSTNLGSANGFADAYTDTTRVIVPNSIVFLDNPATTSSTTYTIYIRQAGSAGSVQFNSQGGTVTLTLMELAYA